MFKYFIKIIESVIFPPAYYIIRGNTYYAEGKYHEAITLYDQALEIDPNESSAHYNKGIALRRLEKYEEAITSYDVALDINPEYASAHYNKGIALNELKRYEEALASFNKSLEIDPHDTRAHNNKGISLSKLGQYNEALASFNKALEIDPHDVDIANSIKEIEPILQDQKIISDDINAKTNLHDNLDDDLEENTTNQDTQFNDMILNNPEEVIEILGTTHTLELNIM